MVSIVDAERYGVLLELGMPLVVKKIELAHVVAINKMDVVSEKEIEEMIGRVSEINPEGTIYQVSAPEGTNMAALVDRIGQLWD